MADDMDGREVRFTAVDRGAQRLACLALLFANASSPLSSTEVYRLVYAALDETRDADDSETKRRQRYEKAYQRDRGYLDQIGMGLIDVGIDEAGDHLWRLDPMTVPAASALTPDEALVVDVMCRPLCADPGFPYADDLMHALLKVNASFSEDDWLPAVSLARQQRPVQDLYAAHIGRVPARLRYRDAQGRESERTVCALGVFQLRGRLYFVCFPVPGKNGFDLSDPRTLRSDRILEATPLEGPRYEVPAEFAVADYRKLPFQMGEALYEGVFRIPENTPLASVPADGARIEQTEEGALLTAAVSDEACAASWAVAEGLVPVSPESLVGAYRALLEGVAAHVDAL